MGIPYTWAGVDRNGNPAAGQGTVETTDRAALDAFGIVCPFQIPDYADLPATFALLAELGVKTIRGRWMTGGRGDQVMSLCASHGIQWLATLIPESWAEPGAGTIAATSKTLKSRLTAMLTHPDAGSVLIGVENANEPNHVRGGGEPLADWPERCAAWGQTIRDAQTGRPWAVLSPAMHDIADDDANGGHWQALADAGCTFDAISLHAYPKGKEATNLLPERLGRVNAAYPSRPPVWLTEFGWMTDPSVTGPAYTSPAQAADYMAAAPAALYGFGGQVERSFYYELLGVDRGIYRGGAWEPAGVRLRSLLA